jgi:hypothetical protein
MGKASEKLFNSNVLKQAMSTGAINADLLKKASFQRGQACGQKKEAIVVCLYPQFLQALAQFP